MTAYEILSVILGALGLAGGAIGFLRAVAADRRSNAAEATAADAQADAASALSKSADAAERIAAAVEVIARRRGVAADTLRAESPSPELEALLGRQEVRWVVEARLPANSFRLRNVGTIPARDVSIGDSLERSDLESGAATIFSAAGNHSGAIDVSWRDDSAGETRRSMVELPRIR